VKVNVRGILANPRGYSSCFFDSVWIVGSSRSGRDRSPIEQFCTWIQSKSDRRRQFYSYRQMRNVRAPLPQLECSAGSGFVLLLMMIIAGADRIVAATQGKYPFAQRDAAGFSG